MNDFDRNDPYMVLINNCSYGSRPLHISAIYVLKIDFRNANFKSFDLKPQCIEP